MAKEEKRVLEAKIQQMISDHDKKLSSMEEDFKQRLQQLEESSNAEIKVTDWLFSRHRQDPRSVTKMWLTKAYIAFMIAW